MEALMENAVLKPILPNEKDALLRMLWSTSPGNLLAFVDVIHEYTGYFEEVEYAAETLGLCLIDYSDSFFWYTVSRKYRQQTRLKLIVEVGGWLV